jgi:hypothetical protein
MVNMKIVTKDNRIKILKVITILALAAYVIKNMFVGMDVDEEYAVVAGYRIAVGDRLLKEMWEPHQTAAIFTAIFEKPMLLIMGGSADFLDLYLKAVYFIVHSLITVFIYKTLKKCVADLNKNAALLTALLFFVTSPKSAFIPEYSNLHIWFFALLTMSLVRYRYAVKNEKSGLAWIVMSGLCITGDVMAYPATVILLPVCLYLIYRCRKKDCLKDIIGFIAPCAVSFAVFCVYLLSYMSPSEIMEMVGYILSDGSHQMNYAQKLVNIASEIGIMALVIIVSGVFAYAAEKLCCKRLDTKGIKDTVWNRDAVFALIFLLIQIIIQFVCLFTSIYSGYYPQIIYVATAVLGIILYCKGSRSEKTGLFLILMSFAGYICVLAMSNWGPMNLNCYMIMGIIGGFVCIHSYFKDTLKIKGMNGISLMCLLIILCNVFGYCYLIIGGEGTHSTIFTVGGYGKGGVKAGIISSWMSAHRYNTNMEMWDEMIPSGSNVLYVGQSQCFYLMGDCVIASPNTISTPVWDDKILKYWEINPDRYPDVIVFESWYGDVWYSDDNYVMQWVESEYGYSRMEEYPYVTVYYK